MIGWSVLALKHNGSAENLSSLPLQKQVTRFNSIMMEPLNVFLSDKVKEARTEKYASRVSADTHEGARLTEKVAQKRPDKVDGCYTANFDVRTAEEISAEDINHFLDGILVGKGEKLIQEAEKNGLNPVFLAAIAIHEGDHGKSRISLAHNNPFGILIGKDCKIPKDFEDAESAIEYTADRLANSKYYVKGGNVTVGAIQQVYCPVGAANDPKGLNSCWLSGVLSWMNKIQKRSEASQRQVQLASSK
jgi:hypothetical protein